MRPVSDSCIEEWIGDTQYQVCRWLIIEYKPVVSSCMHFIPHGVIPYPVLVDKALEVGVLDGKVRAIITAIRYLDNRECD